MGDNGGNTFLRYTLAVVAVVLAVGVRLLLDPLLNERLPFTTLFAAVVFVAWYGGRWPAILCLLLGLPGVTFFVLEPRHSLAVAHQEDLFVFLFYVAISAGCIALFEQLRSARRWAEENTAEARQQYEQLQRESELRQQAEATVAEESERLRVTLTSIGDGVITTDDEGRVAFLNDVAQQLTGWSQQEAEGVPLEQLFVIINETTRQPVENPALRSLREGKIVGLANHTLLISKDGTERPIDDSAAPIRDHQGHISGCVLVFRDVTARRLEESLLKNQNRVLEQVVRSGPLTDILDDLCQAIEQRVAGGAISTVLLTDEGGINLRHAAGGRCPEEYSAAINPVPVGPNCGSCGTAAFRGEPVVVADIATDPLWTDYRDVALRYSLQACWSVPVLSSTGAVLGTFAVYSPAPRRPSDQDLQVMEFLARTAGIAIERQRAEQAVRESELRYRLVGMAANDAIWDWNLVTDEVMWNEGLNARFGYTAKQVGAEATWWIENIHPDDRDRITHSIHCVIDGGQELWQEEYRFRRVDGSYAAVFDRGRVVRDAGDRPVRMVGSMLDLTERKLAEESLRYQLDLTKSITDTVTTAIFMMDDKSRCTFMNPAAEAMTGYTFEEVKGGVLHDFIHHHRPDGRPYPMPECPIDRALPENGEVRDHEDMFIRKNGDFFPVLLNALVIYKQGIAVGTVVEVQDITVRKQAETALRESEERFRGIFTQTLAGIAEVDLTGQFVHVNQRYCEIVGRSADELYDLRMQDITHPDDLSRNLLLFEQAAADGTPFVIDKRYVRPDGSSIWVSNSVSIVRGGQGQPEHIVAAAIDISERKRAEEQLADALRFYHSSIDALSSHIAVLDENGVILEVNHAWRHFAEMNHFAGFNCGVGANYIEVCETSSDECADDGSIARGIRDVLAERLSLFEFEYPCHSPTEERWFLMRVTRFQSLGPVRVVVSHENVTQRRAAEERLRKLAAELSEADHRKNEFLATLAHELRNPLAPIRNGLQLIHLAGRDWATVEQARDLIDRQLNQMVRLVDDLMDVSRISTGKVQLRKECVPLASVVQSAVETSRPLIEQMGHDLTVTLPERPLFLEVDQTRLAQVLLNLLNNAAKYSERNGRIRLTAEQQGSEVVVSVKDVGIGIPAEQLPHVFEMFSQVDRSLEKSQGGLGIGLSLVKRLVELHGGSIEARSEGLGKGAEFVVRLPVVVESSAPTEEAGRLEEGKSAHRILIVDDNRDSADSLAMMLKLMGNETCTAYDGEEAVTGADRFRPDVILLDIGLPKLNGYEACRRIRGLEPGKEMVIIAQTGWGQDEDRQRTQEAGFDHHLVKPVDPQALMKMLRSLS